MNRTTKLFFVLLLAVGVLSPLGCNQKTGGKRLAS